MAEPGKSFFSRIADKVIDAPGGALRGSTSTRRLWLLLDGAADLREHSVSVRPDEPDSAHHNHQNDRQHYRVLSDILTTFILPKILPDAS
jgi:hypothetical protein